MSVSHSIRRTSNSWSRRGHDDRRFGPSRTSPSTSRSVESPSMSPATTTAPSAPRRRNSARLDEVRSARRGSRDRLPSPARARTRTRWRARGGGPRPRARTRRARTPGGTPRATTRPRPARRRVSRPTTSRGFRVPSERNTRRGAPARPPPPPRPRRPLRLPPPRRDRTSSPRARTPGRAPLALARDFRGAIRAFRVESFSRATRQVEKIGRTRQTETALRPPSTVIFFQSFLSLSKEKKRTTKKYISYAHQSDTFAPSIDGGRRVSFFHAF